MNKTLALLAALGLVVSTAAFAEPTAADLAQTQAKATEAKTDAAADASVAKAKATATEVKADAKADKKVQAEAAKVDANQKPAAGATDAPKQ